MTQSEIKSPQRWTWEQVCARRLERHGLSDSGHAAHPEDVVRAMCGAHAQIMSAAELSVSLRSTRLHQPDIRAALWDERSLVKSYGPRGTVHLLPTQDLPMWTGALSATPHGQSADPYFGLLTPEQAEAVVGGIAFVLQGAEMTTDELTQALVNHLGAWVGEPVMPAFQSMWPRWRIAQSTAGARGAFCFGPNRGRNVTYTSPQKWLPGYQPPGFQPHGFQPAEQQAALGELLISYLRAYGPADPQHFAKWLAAPRQWAAELFDSFSSQLQPVEVDGEHMWVAARDADPPAMPPSGVRLLPYFDAYVVGSYPREWLYPGKANDRALARGQAGNFPVLLIDGVVAGIWHMRRSGKRLEITVEPFGELSSAQHKELAGQVERIGEILQGNPQLTIGAVTSGPHA